MLNWESRVFLIPNCSGRKQQSHGSMGNPPAPKERTSILGKRRTLEKPHSFRGFHLGLFCWMEMGSFCSMSQSPQPLLNWWCPRTAQSPVWTFRKATLSLSPVIMLMVISPKLSSPFFLGLQFLTRCNKKRNMQGCVCMCVCVCVFKCWR